MILPHMPHVPALRRTLSIGLLAMALPLVAGCSVTPTVSPPSAGHGALPAVRLGAGVRGVSVLVEPDDGLSSLTRAIRDANSSVWLTMYLLTNHSFIHALEYAHAFGVDVRVILERHPYGMSDTSTLSAYNNLMAADIPVHWANSRFLLTHEKSMLIDGATAYIMTTNFTSAAFHTNREFDVIDANPTDVAALHALFLADWTGRPYTPSDPNLPLSPTDARTLLSALIASARRSLDVYAEELQDSGMEQVLAAAARRGVHVRLLLPAPSGIDRDAPGVALITAAGAQVRRVPQSALYIHAKVIIVDGRRAFVGSQNLSAASLDRNRELGVIVADPSAIIRLQATFNTDWGGLGQ